MKKLILFTLLILGVQVFAQTEEELKKDLAAKKEAIAKLQGEANAIQAKIDALPGWRKGAFGTIGGSLSGYHNWYSKEAYNSSAGNIGITLNAFANLLQDKYFWRNSAGINLAWVKLDNLNDDTDSDQFNAANDVFGITSLFGYKLTEKLAASSLAEYKTTLIENFNNPGYLDAGLGATWTPLKDLVVVVHPLNYNFIFSKGDAQYESSLGAKIVADYTRKFGKLNFKTNLSSFYSYKDADYSNWTWVNSFGYTLWKGIGLGFDFGLRQNKQEAFNIQSATDSNLTLHDAKNDLQSYWMFGVNYGF